MSTLSLNMRNYTRRRPVGQLIKDVKKLCRLCLQKSEDITPIFEDGSDLICATLSLRIMICVGLEVTRDESLPNIICSTCHQELDRYYKFKKKCQESYQRLKLHLLALKESDGLRKAVAKGDKEREANIEDNTDYNMEKVNTMMNNNELSTWDYHGLANINIVNGDISIEVQESCNVTTEENKNKDSMETESQIDDAEDPEISSFLSTVLVQLGILEQQDSTLSILDHSVNNLELVMHDDELVNLELVEEDDVDSGDESQSLNMVEEVKPIVLNSTVSGNNQDGTRDTPSSDNVEEQVITIKWKPDGPDTPDSPDAGGAGGAGGAGRAWCGACRRWFASRSTLRRHARTHSGERPHACHCGKRFAQRAVLERHRYVHLERRPFSCAQCGKSFTQRGALDAHARAHAAPPARALHLHACARCPKVFLYASSLSRHMLAHKGRLFGCGACQRQFRDKSSLQRHARNAHARARPSPRDSPG